MIGRKRKRIALALAGAVVMLVSACGPAGFNGLYNVPLPGGADLGDDPYTIRAEFTDVLDLVPQAMVKVNDVASGKVERIELEKDNKTALVVMRVNGRVSLPANATAMLRQSSLLGEKYVSLSEPKGNQGSGKLDRGATIPTSRTNRNAEVEEVLGALSLLLNNGGIQQVQSITKELNKALAGREPELRSTLSRVSHLAHELNGQRDNITRAIDGLNTLSSTVAKQRKQIASSLDSMEPGLRAANKQRDQIVDMLGSLRRLSGVATDTIDRSRDDLLKDLRSLSPTLHQLSEAGKNIPKSMQILLSYPFADHALKALKGDYFNADITLDFQLDHIMQNLGKSSQPGIPPLRPDHAGFKKGDSDWQKKDEQQKQQGEQQKSDGQSGQQGLDGIFGNLVGGGS